MDTKASPVPLTDDHVRAMARGDLATPEVERLIEAHAANRGRLPREHPSPPRYDTAKHRPRVASADEASRLRDSDSRAADKDDRGRRRPDQKPPQ